MHANAFEAKPVCALAKNEMAMTTNVAAMTTKGARVDVYRRALIGSGSLRKNPHILEIEVLKG